MGYHIIKDLETLTHEYVETFDDLYFVDGIHERSIVYQAHEEWEPKSMGKDEKFENVLKPEFRAVKKAEILFQENLRDQESMFEILNQDKESYQKGYNIGDKALTRDDILLGGECNYEIEVKARSLKGQGADQHFSITLSNVIK